MAVKVTEVPAHTGFWLGAMDTLTGNEEFTVMVMVFEVAVDDVTQVRLVVITT